MQCKVSSLLWGRTIWELGRARENKETRGLTYLRVSGLGFYEYVMLGLALGSLTPS